MSTVRINVGGKKFATTRPTWAKSPVLDMILRRSAEPVPFIDRSPAVFGHILDWLREGRLYIDCPSDDTYERLCADADFYGLEDLSRFLANRINLCRAIYFQSSSETPVLCNLDAFRTLEPADGFIDRLLAGDPAALAQITFVDADTVLFSTYLGDYRYALLRPHIHWAQCCYYGNFETWKMFFGSRLAKSKSHPFCYDYNPVLRAEPKA